mmetsp:Transcript_20823/g.35663  ORF Transcript_20823/g.35663 Transcript_20823/m.35663 type:complete len:408 (-) Transcript_20823:50-1273(-)
MKLILLFIFLSCVPICFSLLFESNVGSPASAGCGNIETIRNNWVSVSNGDIEYHVGFDQVSSNDQDACVAKYNINTEQFEYCDCSYDTTPPDTKGYGILWEVESDTIYVAFSQDGGSNEPESFTRFTSGGWFNSYGQGGGPSVALLLSIDGSDGSPNTGTYIRATLSNGNANTVSITELSPINVEGDNYDIIVKAFSAFAPVNVDKSRMDCENPSGFDWDLIFPLNFQSPISSCADRCEGSPECDISDLVSSTPMPSQATTMPTQTASLTRTPSVSQSNSATLSQIVQSSTSRSRTPSASSSFATSSLGSESSIPSRTPSAGQSNSVTSTPSRTIAQSSSSNISGSSLVPSSTRTPSVSNDDDDDDDIFFYVDDDDTSSTDTENSDASSDSYSFMISYALVLALIMI